MTAGRGELSLGTKLGFGVCDLGGNLFFTAMAFWLPMFLTDVVGLGAGLMGIALLIGKLWDAVTDPAMGHISDLTVSKWGRRRPYIFWGSFPLFISIILLFTSPGHGSQPFLFLWATGVYCLACTAYTVVNIPYSALTPDLTSDYHEQTVLNGFRMSFAVVGTIVGAGAALPLVGLFRERTTGFTVMGTIFGFLMMASALITVFSVREPVRTSNKDVPSLIGSYKSVLKNVPFILIAVPWTMFILGVTVISGMVGYYFTYVYKAAALTSVALLILLLTSLAFIPLWVKFSKRIGKRNGYAAGMLILTAAILLFFFIGHRSIVYGYFIMVLSGIGLSTHYVFPFALVPDIIEWDYAKTGTRKEGVYYGTWTFISKIGAAFAAAIIGWVLAAFGYVANIEQSASSLFGIRLLIGPIPAAAFLIGIAVLMFYPINNRNYGEILKKVAELDRQKNGK